ncbi:uncharacterized protein ACNS7B_018738 isoform 2-T2 [Menidia menidia]
MSSLLLFGLCVCVLLSQWTEAGPHSTETDNLMMFATQGDRITLPCGLTSIKSCSSIKWNKVDAKGFAEEVKAGEGRYPKDYKHRLLKDCSLEISRLAQDDACLYSCENGKHTSNVSLHLLEISENPKSGQNTMELQCWLNIFKGYHPCDKNSGIDIKWTTLDDTPIQGKRFEFGDQSPCFSKLKIFQKLTDHHRKWKCHVVQSDMIKASVTYTTTVKDGVEEVFAAAGESVSLACSSTSSLSIGGSVPQAGETNPVTDSEPERGQTAAVGVNKRSSLVISDLSPLHARDYQCTEQEAQTKIRLHVLDVSAEADKRGENLTLTCVLTCANECEEDFNLTWSGTNQEQISMQSRLMKVSNTLKKVLFLSVWPRSSAEVTCSVHREGAVMASKKWRSPNSLLTPAWLGLPLGLLMCAAAAGLYRHKKKKDAANEQSRIEMVRGTFSFIFTSDQLAIIQYNLYCVLHRIMFMRTFRMRNKNRLSSKEKWPRELTVFMICYSL